MKSRLPFLLSVLVLIACETKETKTVQFEQWITTADKSMLLEKVKILIRGAIFFREGTRDDKTN